MLTLHHDGEVAELVVDRAAKRNAMSLEMWESLPRLVAEVDADPTVKVLVVRGDGPHFCAGADIGEFADKRGTPAAAAHYGDAVEAAAHALTELAKPTIALVQGYCIGGGCELALACDLRLADTTAQFAITPAKLGIVYNFTSTRQLVSVVGPSFAKYLLLSANRVDASEALRVGLVDQLVEPEALDKAGAELAATICSRSQVSVRGAKRMVQKVLDGLDTTDDEARALPLDAVSDPDYREGVAAFLAKRAPIFGTR